MSSGPLERLAGWSDKSPVLRLAGTVTTIAALVALVAGGVALVFPDDAPQFLVDVYEDRAWILILAGLALGLGLGLLIGRGRRRRGRPDSSAIRRTVPHAPVVWEFVDNSILAPDGRLEKMRGVDHDLHVIELARRWSIRGRGLVRHDDYTLRNESGGPTAHFYVLRMGGSFAQPDEVRPVVHRVVGGTSEPMRVEADDPLPAGATFGLWRARFEDPLASGEEAHVRVEAGWPGGMLYDKDTAFVTDTVQFAQGIERLDVTIDFDTDVTDIEAYWWDVESGQCKLADNRPKPVAGNEKRAYTWFVNSPKTSRMYFLVFDRGPEPEPESV